MKKEDFLVEVHSEELPPKALLALSTAFGQEIKTRLEKADLSFEKIQTFATPRRLAVQVINLTERQPDQEIERKGPALAAAFDANGQPSKACEGFARSCGVTPKELITIKQAQGEWVGYRQHVSGKSVVDLLPTIVAQALAALPIPKRMHWGESDELFVRPVHAVILLYGDQIVKATILGCEAGRVTRGHRFMAPDWITIPHAANYASLLQTEGYVITDFNARRAHIREGAQLLVQQQFGQDATVLMTDALLDEVTGLVEWPVVLQGQFDPAFLTLPKEVLISSMEAHQRYFPVADKHGELLPHFIVVSNIESHEPQRVTHGNERVLHARLSDAAFFFAADQKEPLSARLERLRAVVFQAKLGTLYDKAARLSRLAAFIAQRIDANTADAERAGWLAKTDLTTNMVNEFPELQGVMGSYYARGCETENVAIAMREHYLPRFAGDELPSNAVAQALAIADRIDLLTGSFGIHQLPTGDKDPFGLRRAALGVLRLLIEKQISLDLSDVLQAAVKNYEQPLDNTEAVPQILNFLQERLRAYYLEKGIGADVFAAVAALGVANPLDLHQRIHAVMSFKQLAEAEALSIANKRVSNILEKSNHIEATAIDATYFEHEAEKILAAKIDSKSQQLRALCDAGQYTEGLIALADLRQPVDDFFDHVMVMTDDKLRRENRLLLLKQLRALFLRVADIALLQ